MPGEIWCFVDFSDQYEGWQTHFEGSSITNTVFAVIENAYECENLTKDHADVINSGSMFTPIVKEIGSIDDDGDIEERTFYLADVESIVEPLCVIPDIGSEEIGRYLVVQPRRKWADNFVQWLNKPFVEDKNQMSDEEDDE